MLKKLSLQVSFLIVFTFSFFSFNVWAASPDYDLTREAGDARGTVTFCGQAVQDILIYARGTSFDARTDSLGNFKISYFQQGTYDLVVKKDGSTIGSIAQVNIVKKQTTDVGIHNFCNDLDGDSYSPPADCDDTNPNINPGVAETCGDGIDNNCDGTTDEGCVVCTDNDSDGFFAQTGCGTAIDCNDTDAAVNPQAAEVCDNIDNNCNGFTDETGSIGEQTFYEDLDLDTYGSSTTVTACNQPDSFSAQGGDCNDADPSVNPGAVESCDGIDNDCNAGSPDGTGEGWLGSACDGQDSDLCTEGIFMCVAGAQACNDTTSDNIEICDGIDNDCDGTTDEGLEQSVPNGTLVCDSGGQTLQCVTSFGDCDSLPGNGCELDLSSDPNNCGFCNFVCPPFGDQDLGVCSAGQCL